MALDILSTVAQAAQAPNMKHLFPHLEGLRPSDPPQRNPFPPPKVEDSDGPRETRGASPRGGLSVAQLMLSPIAPSTLATQAPSSLPPQILNALGANSVGSLVSSPACLERSAKLSVDFLSSGGSGEATDWGSEMKRKPEVPKAKESSDQAAEGPGAKRQRVGAKKGEEAKGTQKAKGAGTQAPNPKPSKATKESANPPAQGAHGSGGPGALEPAARRPSPKGLTQAHAHAHAHAHAQVQPLNLVNLQGRKMDAGQQALLQQHTQQQQQLLLSAQQLGLMSTVPNPSNPATNSHSNGLQQLMLSKTPHPLDTMYQQQLQQRMPMMQQQQRSLLMGAYPPNGAFNPGTHALNPAGLRAQGSDLNPFGELAYQGFGRVAEKDIPSTFSMNESMGLQLKVEAPDMKKGPNRHSKYCHFCQHIKNTMVACTSGPCTFKFCHHCLTVHLHEEWDSILLALRRGTWKCPCCRNKCCCCSTRRCTENHPHCKAYRKRLQTKISGAADPPAGAVKA